MIKEFKASSVKQASSDQKQPTDKTSNFIQISKTLFRNTQCMLSYINIAIASILASIGPLHLDR